MIPTLLIIAGLIAAHFAFWMECKKLGFILFWNFVAFCQMGCCMWFMKLGFRHQSDHYCKWCWIAFVILVVYLMFKWIIKNKKK